jgi:transcriptional regulator GlxA family with amidase domain
LPDGDVRQQLYLVEGDRIRCAGGVASLDLMRDLIGRAQRRRRSAFERQFGATPRALRMTWRRRQSQT